MASKLKKFLQRTPVSAPFVRMADQLIGRCHYHLKPELRGELGEAFNDQRGRQEIFKAIVGAVDFEVILETGTFRGLTTQYMHETSGLRVMTTESNPKYFGFSSERFKKLRGVSIVKSDSRAFLKSALAGLKSASKPVFLYLDAHWYADLPLRDEVEIVFTQHPNSVVLIDDFEVPDDEGYGYDDYGDGMTLHLPYFDPIARLGFSVFFPTLPSGEETGAKRGCVVLVKEPALIEAMRSLDVLREHAPVHAMS